MHSRTWASSEQQCDCCSERRRALRAVLDPSSFIELFVSFSLGRVCVITGYWSRIGFNLFKIGMAAVPWNFSVSPLTLCNPIHLSTSYRYTHRASCYSLAILEVCGLKCIFLGCSERRSDDHHRPGSGLQEAHVELASVFWFTLQPSTF
jgi:hypothetical protein